MNRKYTVTIEEDSDEGTFGFSIQGSGDTPVDMEDLCDLLVEVAQVIYEEHRSIDSQYVH